MGDLLAVVPLDPVALAREGPTAMLLVFIVAAAVALVKGTFVPGWVYRQERAQRERAEAHADKTADALTALAKAVANGTNGPRA